MQIANREIFRRSRYYHSQMDMDLLVAGKDYEDLPDSYVIFICDFDPIGLGKYRYTLKTVIEEEESRAYDDGVHTVFLSTKGKNDTEVPEGLVKFLQFVGGKLPESALGDTFVKQLAKSIEEIKMSREMGEKFMLLEEMLREEYRTGKEDGRTEGKAEGKAEGKSEGQALEFQNTVGSFLEAFGEMPEELAVYLLGITDRGEKNRLIRKATTASSMEEFMQGLDL